MTTTPRPWAVNEIDPPYEPDEPLYEISSMQDDGMAFGYRWFSKDDADLIVRAVNAHDALVEALKAIRDSADDPHGNPAGYSYRVSAEEMVDWMGEKARATLLLAGVES